MMKFKMRDDNRGLTLLELLVGVAILAIIVTPLLHTFITGANTARKNKLYSDANLAARNIIEEIEAKDMATYLSKNKFSLVEDKDDPDYGKYSITQKNVPDVGSELDTKITIEEADSATIPLSNQMDARFDMQEVDATAYKLFIKSATDSKVDEGSVSYNFSKLNRYITIDVNEIDKGTCKVTVTFEYFGSVKKTYIDGDNNPHVENIDFSYPVVSEMNVMPHSKKRGAFAVYLFFNAYDVDDTPFNMGKTVINNSMYSDFNTDYDFNVFLIDVNDYDGAQYDVEYKPKVEGRRANLLTNMKNVTYKVYKRSDSIWQTPEEVETTLVETDAINRQYNITVEIYKHDDDSHKILSMETSKLDYSAQYKEGQNDK